MIDHMIVGTSLIITPLQLQGFCAPSLMSPRVNPGFCRAPLCQRTFRGRQGLRSHHTHSRPCSDWYKAQLQNLPRPLSPGSNESPEPLLPWSANQSNPLASPPTRRNKPTTVEEVDEDDEDDGLGVDGLSSDDEPSPSKGHTETHPTAGKTYGKGRTFMQEIDEDVTSPESQSNIYHPFASRQDFEMGAWLSQSNVSMSQIDDFLKLPYVSIILSV